MAEIHAWDLAGWDPIFEYEGQTYAEMEKEAKVGELSIVSHWHRHDDPIIVLTPRDQNRISHRYKALVKFQQWLAEGQQ